MSMNDYAQTVMAFDYGTRRIGVAVGQTVSRTATALKIVHAKNGNPRWDDITKLIDEWAPDMFVVGKPSYDDGRRHPLDDAIERFSRRLTGRYSRSVAFVDEHLSSYEASQTAISRPHALDADAARVILRTWFEQMPSTDQVVN
ncbi:MAG: Holliday junction resolvase RuvX [Proteobacteria bacterium]|nr:Holliday junction resolvase RuvX [Pseudomonadota bacterium]